jgi:hypothetical protein
MLGVRVVSGRGRQVHAPRRDVSIPDLSATFVLLAAARVRVFGALNAFDVEAKGARREKKPGVEG